MSLSFVKQLTFTALTLILLWYFSWQAIYSNSGIITYFKLQSNLRRDTTKLHALTLERLEIEHKATILKPSSVDKDMLDELSRQTLGLASANETVIINNKRR